MLMWELQGHGWARFIFFNIYILATGVSAISSVSLHDKGFQKHHNINDTDTILLCLLACTTTTRPGMSEAESHVSASAHADEHLKKELLQQPAE